MKYLSSDISENAYTLCGGEEANGFELWRNLQLQYGGGSKVVEIGGVRKFMDYPRCTSETGVVKHITGWEQLLTKYGSELRQTPEMLRILILGIVPKHNEDKITVKRVKYGTHQSIIQYCRERFEVSRQQEISDALHGKAKRGYMNQVGEAEQPEPAQEEKPTPKAAFLDDLYHMIAALGEGKGGGRGRPGKGEGKGDRERRPSAGLKKKFTMSFVEGLMVPSKDDEMSLLFGGKVEKIIKVKAKERRNLDDLASSFAL